MPARCIRIDERDWRVYPSGFLTPSMADEFGLIFVHGQGEAREVRVTRYSPVAQAASTAREQSLAALSNRELTSLFRSSQPSERSPEAGYQS
ncbi:MAG: hypothetical protein IPP90_18670 [Gemmatimonadaceae bacterium]|nr:hypothetical protein [Gemmatimonadaceae bacterium]